MSHDLTKRDVPGRIVRDIHKVEMQKNVWGETSNKITWYPLSFMEGGIRKGCYLYEMEAGSESEIHTHKYNEDYLILEGELIEDDGTVLKPGDFVHYDKGTTHNSHTHTGCLIFVSEWD